MACYSPEPLKRKSSIEGDKGSDDKWLKQKKVMMAKRDRSHTVLWGSQLVREDKFKVQPKIFGLFIIRSRDCYLVNHRRWKPIKGLERRNPEGGMKCGIIPPFRKRSYLELAVAQVTPGIGNAQL
uniref:Uncharacterized protein n=1 Tax=Phyllostachys edulis TaxID=38705 RepID=D3IVE3_PHYED|nr:hypothetical protein [Phyllostachys edulis]